MNSKLSVGFNKLTNVLSALGGVTVYDESGNFSRAKILHCEVQHRTYKLEYDEWKLLHHAMQQYLDQSNEPELQKHANPSPLQRACDYQKRKANTHSPHR